MLSSTPQESDKERQEMNRKVTKRNRKRRERRGGGSGKRNVRHWLEGYDLRSVYTNLKV